MLALFLPVPSSNLLNCSVYPLSERIFSHPALLLVVPMLMGVGIAPESTQAAYRIGDGPVNLTTPLMPCFPLVLAFCRRCTTGLGVGRSCHCWCHSA